MNYLQVKRAKKYCSSLPLFTKGTKSILISKIIHFIKTGEKIEVPKYPAISCTKSTKTVGLRADTVKLTIL